MERLLKRRNLQQRLDEVVKEIGKNSNNELCLSTGDVVESQRMMSDSSTRYVLIKKALEKSPEKNYSASSSSKKNEVTIADDESIDDHIFALNDDGLTQEELFTIVESQQSKISKFSSSSEDDSDFEEVPQPKSLFLHIPINTQCYSAEEDMFADVFCTPQVSYVNATEDITEPGIIFDKTSSKTGIVPLLPEASPKKGQDLIFDQMIEKCNLPADSVSSHFVHMSSSDSDSDLVEVIEPKSNEPISVVKPVPSDVDQTLAEENVPNKKPSPSKTSAIGTESNLSPKEIEAEKASRDIWDHQSETFEESDSDISIQNEPHATKPALISEKQAEMSSQRKQELEELERNINQEQEVLIQQQGKQQRLAASITDQMYAESQVCSRIFLKSKNLGVPYSILYLFYLGLVKIVWNTIPSGTDGS